ncbi:transcription initiation factor TFIID [Penicillium taxi]|uniref:transcription initiation factor TFIID n=1 Tax=Penicillium taxi TaxID=168475 RepID=UPI0025459257|nr:transcription initiation factor TFIID [Penicillium taxi]KAJ5899230.1 transcription initiation factor TFIID [Penicillium taxi]
MSQATSNPPAGAPEDDEFENVMRQLNNLEEGGPQMDFLTRDLEVGEKADDAIDFEDFDDDDLPEEEEAPSQAQNLATDTGQGAENLDADDLELFGTGDDLFEGPNGEAQPQGNEYDDLFGETFPDLPAGQVDDLFEDDEPTDQFTGQPGVTPAPKPEANMFEDEDAEMSDADADDDNMDDMDPATLRAWKMQLQLFAMSGTGPDHVPAPPENHEELLKSLFPTFNHKDLPRWLELIPTKRSYFVGKQPNKIPKAVLPTKVNIELAPDQDRVFKTGQPNKRGLEHDSLGIVFITEATQEEQEIKEDSDTGEADADMDADETLPGGFTMQDLRVICANWDIADEEDFPTVEAEEEPPRNPEDDLFDNDLFADAMHPSKKRKTGPTPMDVTALSHVDIPLLDDPELATAEIAKSVIIDLNDPNILVEELRPELVLNKSKPNVLRAGDEVDASVTRRLTQRYNISNDNAYDMLKQNHQHKIRSTLGNITLEHAMPALRLQWPYYKTELPKAEARSFHRPSMAFRANQTSWFKNPAHFKRRHQKAKDAKSLYPSTSSLSLADNSSILLVEYSEEVPMTLSNFGMCNRFINYYRRKNADDPTRPKAEIGETAVLLPQDKSPFSIFGHVDPGEIVPAISNTMYRAPLFPHKAKSNDFLVIRSSTAGSSNYYIRNIDNFFVAGQQFPAVDIPGPHSRKVTTVAKNRMKMLVYRLLKKSSDARLAISEVTAHIPGTTDMQNRQKVKDFLQHDKDTKYWKPLDSVLPDKDTIRAWVQPEDVCLLESMQFGQQHLQDTGFGADADNANDNDDDEEGESFEQKMAPWKASRNFLLASQGKAMLKLHGDGDPTGRGEGFNFIKTSMKGGFKAIGESVEDKLDAARLKELGGHSYNVARQQRSYETSIRRIWDAQKASLSSTVEHSDQESDVDQGEEEEFSKPTPRSEAPTPAPYRRDDDTFSQFSRMSFSSQKGKVLRITRQVKDPNSGEIFQREQLISDPRVIRQYIQHRHRHEALTTKLDTLEPTGDPEVDARNRKLLEAELSRLNRNKERRFAREKQKGISRSGESGPDGKPTGTQRKCANCGQVGHIKTNKKLCPLLNGTMKPEDRVTDSAFSMNAPVL